MPCQHAKDEKNDTLTKTMRNINGQNLKINENKKTNNLGTKTKTRPIVKDRKHK